MKTNSVIEFELEEAGLDIKTERFPYTYHHDYVSRPGISRSDVAEKLRLVCVDYNEYDYSACYGAILYLISEQPEKINVKILNILEYVRAGSVYSADKTRDRTGMRDIIGLI